jgi:hypothetical protein
MKRQLVLATLLLGTACVVRGQDAVLDGAAEKTNVASGFSASPTEAITLFQPPAGVPATLSTSFWPAASSLESATPDPSPNPAPTPKFLYGGRDDFRWQLAIGADWMRFRSAVFNASAVGIATSVTYFTNDWFGVEGVVTTGFAPTIYQNEHVKLLVYGGGPKIAWRERRWEPWAHAIFGGSHEFPQTAGHSKNSYVIEAGGGADYRFNPRLSGRLEADWMHTGFFGNGQNNFELMGGVVFHF